MGESEIKKYSFILTNCDTDSISICKPDMSPFSEEEAKCLLKELNSIMPPGIRFENDGIFETFIVAAAKNYYMVPVGGGKPKVKGSAFKSSKAEPAVKEMQQKILKAITNKDYASDRLAEIYNSYVKEILHVVDMKRWVSRKTITSKVLISKRKNETSIVQAVASEKLEVGNKVWLYYDNTDTLKDVDNWAGDQSTKRLLQKVFKGVQIFKSFLDIKHLLNYTLKKNVEALHGVWEIPYEKPLKKVSKPRKKKNAGPKLVCEPFDSET